MRTITLASLTVSAAAIVMLACGKAPSERAPEAEVSQQPAAQSTATVEREWALVMLGDSAAPLGAGGKPATIRFDSAAKRAAGFAGCNQYSATYTIVGDSLHFGPAISTKMACAEGDSLERAFLTIVSEVSNYQATDSTLTLAGSSGPLARFRAQ